MKKTIRIIGGWGVNSLANPNREIVSFRSFLRACVLLSGRVFVFLLLLLPHLLSGLIGPLLVD